MSLENTKKIKVVSTNSPTPLCTYGCTLPYNGGNFDDNVNHYIEKHGYKLLHVGQESENDNEGKPYHSTVAVLSVK